MREWSIVSWNSMIFFLVKIGRDCEVLELFYEMRIDGFFELDEVIMVIVLFVCVSLGVVDVGKWL